MVTVEQDIYPHYAGTENGDNADKIRDFLRDAHYRWERAGCFWEATLT